MSSSEPTDLLLHNSSHRAIDDFLAQPSHALLLVAPMGSGKGAVAQFIASQLLALDEAKLEHYPYFKRLQPQTSKAISIDEVRELIHFTTLRTPTTARTTSRVVIIENSQQLTVQAQNALLKTIEEPPVGTCLILTAPSERSILPTIRSRIQQISLQIPTVASVTTFFKARGYSETAIKRAIMISGGLPGVMHALLEADTSHPLFAATNLAREVLQKPAFERLLMADVLAKDRELWLNLLFILGQMANIAIEQAEADLATIRRWQRVLAATYEAQAQTQANAQLKLVLLNFMLSL